MRQSLEEVLVDTANLLAETVEEELIKGTLNQGSFAKSINNFNQRRIEARIASQVKKKSNLYIYITDHKGMVVYDSTGQDVGEDYSRWNDVYLTLRGRYGARTTRQNYRDPTSSVMYVAAPIKSGSNIIGVLTVGKPSVSVQPFFEKTVNKIETKTLLLLLTSFALISFVVYWLTLSIRQLTQYARAVQQGKRIKVPKLREKELAQLAYAMEEMRISLEGKNYVENYLHTLTHELKSPLAAIRGAAELLQEKMTAEARQHFIDNITNESQRLQQIVEQLLKLAALEKRQQLEDIEQIPTDALIKQLANHKTPMLKPKQLSITLSELTGTTVEAERFLLQQAISNLLDNAIDFSPEQTEITLTDKLTDNNWILTVRDHGPGIPDYARQRVFERFYSLPRPDNGIKSTGLGLSLVHEVVQLHRGRIEIQNCTDGGTSVSIVIPVKQAT